MITNEYIKETCKIGQGADCCRYLVSGVNGFECAKLSEGLKRLIDHRVMNFTYDAVGDNCPGVKFDRLGSHTEEKGDTKDENVKGGAKRGTKKRACQGPGKEPSDLRTYIDATELPPQ